jgi:hypothetical protein
MTGRPPHRRDYPEMTERRKQELPMIHPRWKLSRDFQPCEDGEPSVVPMPRRRKLARPDPFFALEARHQTLFAKLRPLEEANWTLRHLPENHHRRRAIHAAIADLRPKIDRIEDEIFEWVATHPASPAVLIACINLFRDWVDRPREAMVDKVIAAARTLLDPRAGARPSR